MNNFQCLYISMVFDLIPVLFKISRGIVTFPTNSKETMIVGLR